MGGEIENEERGMTEMKSTYHNSSAARIGQRGMLIWCHFVVSSAFSNSFLTTKQVSTSEINIYFLHNQNVLTIPHYFSPRFCCTQIPT